LYRIWREADSSELRRYAAWAFSTQPVLSRDSFAPEVWGDCDTWFEQAASENRYARNAALVLAWYRRSPWSDAELVEELNRIGSYSSFYTTACEMLATLGEAGCRVLVDWGEVTL
jgi:hypothetical protein